MLELQKRILQDGAALSKSVLKVDSFLTHQVDTDLLMRAASEFASKFEGITKVVTIEASGIAPATLLAYKLGVPLVFAKKHKSVTLSDELLTTTVHSFTKQQDTSISISRQFLCEDDRILIIDDFLANGEAAKGLITLCEQGGAKVLGVGIVIEKSFQPGRELLESMGVKVHSLARVKSLKEGEIDFV
jgi:xanthine phosphoribosyltransferase